MDNRIAQVVSGLRFDPESGAIWRSDGSLATGRPMPIGYLRICVGRHAYYAHRVAWALVTGSWPLGHIDHVNGDRADNRWANLRIASPSENSANSKLSLRNSCGVKGATRVGSKFKAQIMTQGQRIYLGLYETAEEAGAAYEKAAKERFGEFARAA